MQTRKYLHSVLNIINTVTTGIAYLVKHPVAPLIFLAQLQVVLAQAAVPRNGLVGEYLFDTNAFDTSDLRNNAVVYGARFVPDRFGRENSAVDFDGSAYIMGAADPWPTTERSFSFWINPALHSFDATRDRGVSIFGYGGNSVDNHSSLIFNLNSLCSAPNTYSLQSHNNINQVLYTDDSIFGSPSDWIHVVINIDKHSGTEIFLNNVAVKNQAVFIDNTYVKDRNFVIGSTINPNGFGPYEDNCVKNWVGTIDDFRVYNRILTNSERSELYTEQEPSRDNSSDPVFLAALFAALGGLGLGATGTYGLFRYSNHRTAKKVAEEAARDANTSEINKALADSNSSHENKPAESNSLLSINGEHSDEQAPRPKEKTSIVKKVSFTRQQNAIEVQAMLTSSTAADEMKEPLNPSRFFSSQPTSPVPANSRLERTRGLQNV